MTPHPNARPWDDTRANGGSLGTSPVRRMTSQSLLLVGVSLVIWSFFSPWLTLTSGLVGLPKEQRVGPWWVVQRDPLSVWAVGIMLLVLVLALVASALALGLPGRSRPPKWAFIATVTLGFVWLAAWFVVVTAFPTGLSLGYPYYDTTFDYGAWVGLAGFVCILIGVMGSSRIGTAGANQTALG